MRSYEEMNERLRTILHIIAHGACEQMTRGFVHCDSQYTCQNKRRFIATQTVAFWQPENSGWLVDDALSSAETLKGRNRRVGAKCKL